jgi:hypothetical protein
MRRIRSATGAVLLAAALLVGLAGCDLFAPQETLYNGETSDGVSGTTGLVHVVNAVLVTSTGSSANLVANLVNTSTQTQRVEIQLESAGASHTVTAKRTYSTQLGVPGGTIVIFTGLRLKPGSLASMYFKAAGVSGVQLGVPVLTGSQPQYHDLTPEKVASASRPG